MDTQAGHTWILRESWIWTKPLVDLAFGSTAKVQKFHTSLDNVQTSANEINYKAQQAQLVLILNHQFISYSLKVYTFYQLVANWWFGLVVWNSRGALGNNPFHKGILAIETTGPQTTKFTPQRDLGTRL